ncbi:mucin-5AC-like [Diachasmimorpha longicaudata]|uniref:mucin-5AC-like n=1 Tax=Diachasmimorpha longicaudata TaxID=58733 RepID=UPI0030B9139E
MKFFGFHWKILHIVVLFLATRPQVITQSVSSPATEATDPPSSPTASVTVSPSTSSSPITTTTLATTTITTIGTTPASLCLGPGRFQNTTDTTCRSYVLCSLNSDRTAFIAYPLKCPKDYLFKPLVATCVRPTLYTCSIKK